MLPEIRQEAEPLLARPRHPAQRAQMHEKPQGRQKGGHECVVGSHSSRGRDARVTQASEEEVGDLKAPQEECHHPGDRLANKRAGAPTKRQNRVHVVCALKLEPKELLRLSRQPDMEVPRLVVPGGKEPARERHPSQVHKGGAFLPKVSVPGITD